MKKPIDISIVVPFYAGEQFLPRLFGSIVASYKASKGTFLVELIVVVDSMETDTEHVSSVFNQFGSTGGNLSLVIKKNESNLGVAGSRMSGNFSAGGKFITFIDQDDYVGLSYFSVLERNLTDEFDLFLLNGYIEFENQRIRRPVFYFRPRISFEKIARVNFLITPGLLLFNRNRVRFEFRQISAQHPGSDDWACYLDLLSNPALKCAYIRERLFHYVVHDKNYHQDKCNFIISQIRTIQYFQRKYPENHAIKLKLSSLQFRLKRHLSLIKLSGLTRNDIYGFVSLLFIELFTIHNMIWLIWSKRIKMHKK